ncbi:MAG TPA: VirK/YbjX family protein [Gammaproteobacteria bacterium]|nr:VirK/YbjX family protein [Gammaproteobacteria bacterium]
MDPRAGSAEKSGTLIPGLHLESAPDSFGVAVVAHASAANDRLQPAAPSDFWTALGAVYPTARRVFAGVRSKRLVKRVRLSFRAFVHFGIWRRWHAFLTASPFGRITNFYPRFYEKPFRPYLYKSLKSEERCHALVQHYLFLGQHAPKGLIDAVLSNQPYLLNETSMGGLEEPLAINLTYAKHMQQEGELTLSLGRLDSLHTHREHAWIASLTFTVCQGKSGWEMVVGGVQGGHAEQGREDAKLATKLFHGLRPKPLLIHVLREIAACWGIDSIYGVTNDSHCLTRRRYRGRISIKSSYDELWQEAGGVPVAGGFYELPVQPPRRALETVPSRKRSLYQRRFRLLDTVDGEIRAKFGARKVP